MANICVFELCAVAKKYEDLVALLKHIQNDMARTEIDSIEVLEKPGELLLKAIGQCAWSVSSCMVKEPGSYLHGEGSAVSLEEAAKLHDLDIEIFSEEPGCCFSEHIRYDKDGEFCNDCADFYEYYLCDEDSDFITETKINVDEDSDEEIIKKALPYFKREGVVSIKSKGDSIFVYDESIIVSSMAKTYGYPFTCELDTGEYNTNDYLTDKLIQDHEKICKS